MFHTTTTLLEESVSMARESAELELLRECDYSLFQTRASAFVAKYYPPTVLASWTLFCHKLNDYEGIFDRAEKLVLLQAALPCLKGHVEKKSLAHFLKSAVDIKSRFGLRMFINLFTSEAHIPTHSLTTYSAISELLIALKDQPHALTMASGQLPDLSLALTSLRDAHEGLMREKYPQRDIDTVLSDFANQSELVKFALSQDELALLKQEFLAIQACLAAMQEESFSGLKQRAQQATTCLAQQADDDNAKYELIAVMIRMIRFFYAITPHDTQILSLLALLKTPEHMKGRIAQIRTGEGKSLIIALLSGFLSCQGYFVDVVTSDKSLAIRDSKKYASFYKALGLTSSHICRSEPVQKDFAGQILYGQHTDFEFAYLRDGLNQSGHRYSVKNGACHRRTCDVAIIDEVDNLVFDTALNSALIAIHASRNDSWIYAPIYAAMTTNNSLSTEELRHQLATLSLGVHREKLAQIDNERLAKLKASALEAMHEKRENDDYIVKTEWRKNTATKQDNEFSKIIIVDKENTGRLMHGQQWRHGLHQFLQIKHGIAATAETLSAAGISHQVYFNMYKRIYGVTGTMGELIERSEVEMIYTLSSFDTPPRFPCQRIQQAVAIESDARQQFFVIADKVRRMRAHDRPSLILFKSIRDSEAFSQYLRAQRVSHQVLNEVQQQDEDYILSCAGDTGQITIATNTASRGADVVLSPESIQAGGLHLIFAFYPKSLRVEEQGNGRAGRQGQPGTCEMILNRDESSIKAIFPADQPLPEASIILEHLMEARTRSMMAESLQRMTRFGSESLLFQRLQDFFLQLQTLHQRLNAPEFKAEFLARCKSLDDPSPCEMPLDAFWLPVIDYAEILIKDKTDATDWSILQQRFAKQCLSLIKTQWANMYSNMPIHEQTDTHFPEQLERLDQFNQTLASQVRIMLDAVFQEISHRCSRHALTPT